MNITVSIDPKAMSPQEASAWIDQFTALRGEAEGVSASSAAAGGAGLPVEGLAEASKEKDVEEIIRRWDSFAPKLKSERTSAMTELASMGYKMSPPETRGSAVPKAYLRVIHPDVDASIGWLNALNFSFIGSAHMLSEKVKSSEHVDARSRYPKVALGDADGVDLMLRVARAVLPVGARLRDSDDEDDDEAAAS